MAPASVAVGDFNGDGVPDLAVANAGSSNVTILLGKGDGTFTAAASPAVDTASTALSVGDFNGDGKEDIVVANSGESSATALLAETGLGIATVNNILPVGAGTHLVQAIYSGDTKYRGSTSAYASLAVVLQPGFSLTNTPVTITSPGASATSTITITPSDGFSGAVTLTCAVAGPPGAVDAPSCSVTAPAPITGTSAVTATLTVNTTAAFAKSTSDNTAPRNPLRHIFPIGGADIAALLFLAPVVRRRRWNPWLGLLLLAVVAGATIGCGGAMKTAPSATTNPGTTAGTYTVTVSGVGGATMTTTAVTVTVI
jgi:hypothetical protein